MIDENEERQIKQACNVNLYRQFGPKSLVDRWLADKRAEKLRNEMKERFPNANSELHL